MHLTREGAALTLAAPAYTLHILPDRPFARLTPSGCSAGVDLFYLSGVHASQGQEDTPSLGSWQVESDSPAEVVLAISAGSSIWQQKIIRFRCQPDRLDYEIEVQGQGSINQIDYLGGYYSANLRWGSGFFWSGQAFQRGFNPEPDSREEIYFHPSSGAKIDLTGVPLPGRSDWFFTPPPFCFAFEMDSAWLALGIRAAPGGNQYTAFHYHGTRAAFYLSLDCGGQLKVDGMCRLPVLTFDFAENEYAALERYAQTWRAEKPPISGQASTPPWWQTPIFCGWGAQCHLAAQRKGRAPDFARQEHYESFLATLAAHQLHPPIVVIDDKWQSTYGGNAVDVTRWPDLPGFIRSRHAAGQKVLLWLKAWDPEGLPAEECICNASGLPAACDPTHPRFIQHMRAAIRQMLSPEGYGADGFKIDFTARIPASPGMVSFSGAWGLELMRAYLKLIYREAKTVKPDSLVISHTPHPYLADVVDMIRLNDINTGAEVVRQMVHRARVARIACPGALIDTDNWPMLNRAAWRAYLPVQPELGVPALYIDRALDSTDELLEEQDYAQLRAIWQARRWTETQS